ncbi:hypothetical protein EVAR_25771_1 [Eumeta japonica]|uniref:Uncharacterized protein n=1 Tax=Eumeta variegata TaxID=151549 RepID=A0A4C2A500_EUMVA|nr:hypothetical protein EVAR_25771_1 [Eumeta japonica]
MLYFLREAPHLSTVRRWCVEFDRGRVSLHDEIHEDWPSTAITEENGSVRIGNMKPTSEMKVVSVDDDTDTLELAEFTTPSPKYAITARPENAFLISTIPEVVEQSEDTDGAAAKCDVTSTQLSQLDKVRVAPFFEDPVNTAAPSFVSSVVVVPALVTPNVQVAQRSDHAGNRR